MTNFSQFLNFKKTLSVMAVFAVAITVFSFGSYDPYNELSVVTPDDANAQSFVCNLSVVGGNNTVPFGGSATISWNVQGYGPVTLNGDPVANSGTRTINNIQENTTYTIFAELNEGGLNVECNQSVTIICQPPVPPLPECVSFTASPSTINAGESSTLTWSSNNAVSASINQGIGSVSPNGSVVVSPNVTTTYTLTLVGADNETVSCPVTVTVNPVDPMTPVCLSFTASPSTINQGQSSTLSWSTQNATAVSINQGVGSVNLNGSVSVSPTVTTTYTLTVFGTNNQQDTCTATVVVNPAPMVPVCLSFAASPSTINAGQSSTLSWSTQNATAVSINQGVGSVNPNGSISVSPTVTTTYTLTVFGTNNQQVTCTTTIVVTATPVPNCVLNANPLTINQGQSSTLTWSTTNATAVSINQGVGSVTLNGSTVVSPTVTTTYTLLAVGANGQTTSCPVTITVIPTQPVPVCDSFTANPTTINQGQSSTLTWSTTNVNSISISGVTGPLPVDGSTTVSPTQTTTYTLVATGANNQTVSCTATVIVTTSPLAPVCDSFTASPTTINPGQSSTLTWNTTNANSISISGVTGPLPVDGSTVVSPNVTTTYTLLALGDNNQTVSCPVTVTVNSDPLAPVCLSFTASPTTVVRGGTSTLAWSTQNAVSVAINNGIGNVATSGVSATYDVVPLQTTEYTLTVFGTNNQQVTCPATVTVTSTPTPISCSNNVTFTADPSSIRRGNDSTLTWNTTGIDSVRFDNGITATDLSGSVTVSPNDSTTYNLIATAGQTTISCPVRVTVTTGGGGGGSSSPRCELSISKNRIKSGERVTLTWDSTRANDLTIEDQTTNKDIVTTEGLLSSEKDDLFDGTITVSPKEDTTYLMTVTRGSRERTCRVNVEVTDDIVVNQVRDQQPLVSSISLTEVPYTGFEAGPILTVLFYLLLMSWALYVAYLLVIKRDQFGGLNLAINNSSETPTRFIHESVSSDMLKASVATPVATENAPASFLPDNLPIVGYHNLVSENSVNELEETEAEVEIPDHSVNGSEMTELENYAHSKQILLSSDAVNYFVANTNGDAERKTALEEVIKAAKEKYPSEDGWVVLNEKRMKEVCVVCQANSEVKEEAVAFVPASVPTGSGSLAEAIVTGNIISAYEMIGNRPMFALADAAADLDAVYRIRRGEAGNASDMLMKETATLSNDQILQMIQALTGAIDGTYTDEASAVKMSIMKAVKVVS